MKSFGEIRDSNLERDIFLNRVILAIVAIILMVCLVIIRLIYLQVYNHQHYTTLSTENYIKVRPVAPPRGVIYSADGVMLAGNRPSFNLVGVPEKIKDNNALVYELSQILDINESKQNQIIKTLNTATRFTAVPLMTDLSEEQVALFSVNSHKFTGVAVEAGLSRFYPLGSDTAHLLGYVSRISNNDKIRLQDSNYAATQYIGKTGVERKRELLLHGKVGSKTIEINAEGRLLRVVDREPPVPGEDLRLTIDSKLQKKAASLLRDLDNLSGSIVALDVRTGGVLAIVSHPSYDPNAFANGISPELYTTWMNSPFRPLFDRSIQGQYPPGSTIKPLLALVALENGLSASQTVKCNGWFSLPSASHRYRCWEKEGHGRVNLVEAIERSCDVFFYSLSNDIGIKMIHTVFDRFGLGKATGIDLPNEEKGLVPSPEWKKKIKKLPWYPGETVITGIGQGFLLATPLQLAKLAATLANRGKSVEPFIIQTEQLALSDKQQSYDISANKNLKGNDRYWKVVNDSMVAVVHSSKGTARGIGYTSKTKIAGKTGTSQVFSIGQDEELEDEDIPSHLRDHALFVAYAPPENPRIALAVVIEHGGSGSATAAPIARAILDQYFTRKVDAEQSSLSATY